ncbi:MAG: glycerol kinase GlpK [Pseudomonadota bacterium]
MQTSRFIMALDQGTSSSRAIVYHLDGTIASVAQHEFGMQFPQDGWVEQDPEVLWQTTLRAGRDALAAAGIHGSEVACIGITNQRETTLLWERDSGDCLYNAIVWQDRRTADRCEALRAAALEGQPAGDYISATTGLVIDPYFSGTKLAWLLDNVPNARQRAAAGELCFGTVDTFLIWRLSKGARHVTEPSNVSRTQLFDIHQQDYCPALLQLLDIPAAVLPEVQDSAGFFATADAEWFGAEIPITGVAGDQQSALIGQGCFARGMTKCTYGTGCFLMTHTGAEPVASAHQLLTTVAYRLNGEVSYALEGSIFVAGVAIKWLRDQLGLIDSAEDTELAFARCAGDSSGVYVVPAFTGLGAPYWQPHARGLVTGLTLDTSRDQLITAFLQGVVFQTQELVQAMNHDGAQVASLRVDGGMVVNSALCQFLADLLDVPVQRPVDTETTALGAAVLAGLGQGLFTDLSHASEAWSLEQQFDPDMSVERRQQLLAGYAQAVAMTLTGTQVDA